MSSSQTTNSSNSNTSNSSGTSTTAPGYQPQANALGIAFGQAPGALSTAQGYTAPTGTNTNFDTTGLYGNGTTLNNSGTNAATAALSNLSGFNANNTNNTGSIVSAAQQYANGQNIQAQTDAAMQQAKEQVQDVTLPQLSQNAAITGNTNSSRTGIAEGLVDRSLAENSQNTYNSLYGQAYQNGLNLAENQAQANNNSNLSAYTNGASQGTNAAQTGAGEQTTSISNTAGQNANNQTNYSNNVGNAYSALQQYMNLIGSNNWGTTTTGSSTGTSTGTGTSTTQTDPSALSVIGGLLGAAGSAKTLFGSDRRIKENIKRVGTLDNGLPVYTFQYKGHPQLFMGLMAQDVEVVNPDAVVEHPTLGFKMVDYEKAVA